MRAKQDFLGALLVIILISLSFSVCGCKQKAEVSSAEEITSQQSSISKEESADKSIEESNQTVNIVTSDPQNIEENSEDGAEVEAQSLTVKQGVSNGIDVSKWQGKINWKKVKSANIDFAIIRVGYRAENGKIYKDEFADYNIQQADKSGLLIGVYFFSTAVTANEALEEADWTADAIKSYPISYPVVYDCEGYTDAQSRMFSLTNAQRTHNAISFMNRIKSFGYDSMIYASKNELLNYWDTSSIENGHKIWVARYTNPAYPTTPTPDYNGKYDMWQYTNKGIVSGVEGPVDMIVSYFTKQKASPKSNIAPQKAEVPTVNDTSYTEQNDTVTAKDVVNLREKASVSSNIVGTLKNGETLKRTAVGVNGWSKLLYNGKTVYAITSYLTTDLTVKPVTPQVDNIYTQVNEQVTAKSETNLRTLASTNGSTVVHTLKNGEVVNRIGIGSNGWSKILYNGQTVYAVTSYLTTDLSPKQPEPKPETNTDDGFTPKNESVTAKSETNLRDKPSTDGSTVIYTLKNGEYITKTGENSKGWSRLIYNGQTVYAVTSLLTN